MKTTKDKIKWMTVGFLAAHIFLFCVIFRMPKKRWDQDSYDCAIVCGCRVKPDGVQIGRASCRERVSLR